MEQRISLITLGVADLARSRRFYEALGWNVRDPDDEEIAFYQAGGIVFGLWDRDKLAEDSTMTDSGGWGGMTLAYNTRTREEVDEVIEQARSAGAQIGREPDDIFWGGYSGLFIDPDGHPWEVAHNPSWPIDKNGNVDLSS